MIRNRQHILLIILFISIVVNLFLGGMVVSSRLSNDLWNSKATASGGAFMMGRNMLKTDATQNPELMEIWSRREATVHSAMNELHEAQERVRNALEAEPLNKSTLTESLADLRRRTTVSQEQWHQALVEAAAALPSKQRKQLRMAQGHGMRRGMGQGMGRGMGYGMERHTDCPSP